MASNPEHRQTEQRRESASLGQSIGSPYPRPFKRFLVLERPETWITWAARFPDLVKFRKSVDVFPLQFVLDAAYSRQGRSMSYGCSCQDKILKGVVRLDLATKQLHYRKRLQMGGNACVALTAKCNYEGLQPGGDPRPSFSLRYELGNGGSASLGGNDIAMRQRLPVTRNLGIEFCGNVRLPLQTAEYAIEDGHNTFTLGDGPLNLHVEQCNLLFHL